MYILLDIQNYPRSACEINETIEADNTVIHFDLDQAIIWREKFIAKGIDCRIALLSEVVGYRKIGTSKGL